MLGNGVLHPPTVVGGEVLSGRDDARERAVVVEQVAAEIDAERGEAGDGGAHRAECGDEREIEHEIAGREDERGFRISRPRPCAERNEI